MRPKHLHPLLRYLTRMGMYAAKAEEAVVAFLHGYELGADHQCRLTEELNDYLFQKFDLRKTAYGWNGQIREFAKREGLSWPAAFRRLALRYVYDHFDLSQTPELLDLLQSRIRHLMGRFRERSPEGIALIPLDEWRGLVDLRQPAFRKFWTEYELRRMERINEQLAEHG